MSYFLIPSRGEVHEFVTQSNLIEGIRVPVTDKLFLDHLMAVRAAIGSVSEGFIPEPRKIHRILMRSRPNKKPGKYRQVNVWIGRIGTPPPKSVPVLMGKLLDAVAIGICRAHAEPQLWAWDIHNEFEAIHPFEDGNGRTGRIWMNAIRLRLGLNWLVIRAEEKKEYYRRIDEFRRQKLYYSQFLRGTEEDIETICKQSRPLT